MGQTTQSKNNNLSYINMYNKDIYKFGFCDKCGDPLEENKFVVDRKGNTFCDQECKRDFKLEIEQDYDDLYTEMFVRG
jgi:hypothetical protein